MYVILHSLCCNINQNETVLHLTVFEVVFLNYQYSFFKAKILF